MIITKKKKKKKSYKNTENAKDLSHVYMKTCSRQREDTGLTRLQSHSSSFEAFSCTIDDFQWFNNDGRTSPAAGGARPEAAPEPGETAHLAQKDAGSLLFRAGGGLGGTAAAGGAGTGRTAAPGPGGNQAARDRGKKTEQRGGTPGLQQRRLHRINLRWLSGGRAAAPGPGARTPPGRWEAGSV